MNLQVLGEPIVYLAEDDVIWSKQLRHGGVSEVHAQALLAEFKKKLDKITFRIPIANWFAKQVVAGGELSMSIAGIEFRPEGVFVGPEEPILLLRDANLRSIHQILAQPEKVAQMRVEIQIREGEYVQRYVCSFQSLLGQF